MDSIKLLALVKSSSIKEHGINTILSYLVPDLKKLELVTYKHCEFFVATLCVQGVHFDDIAWPVKGTISVCSADNLGSRELGGFKLGGSSFRTSVKNISKNVK